MRIPIREQLTALVTTSVLVSLAIISIPVWVTVNNFIIDVQGKSLASTASLKASLIKADLDAIELNCLALTNRRVVQQALLAYYSKDPRGEVPTEPDACSKSPSSLWCLVQQDIGVSLSVSRTNNLVQARFYPNSSISGLQNGIFTVSTAKHHRLIQGANSNSIVPSLFPNITYNVVNRTTTDENGQQVTLERLWAEPFPGIFLSHLDPPLLLGPFVTDETTAFVSLTMPIFLEKVAPNVVGYLTLVASMRTAETLSRDREGLDKSGTLLVVGPQEPYNRFPFDNPISTKYEAANRTKLAKTQVNFIFPPVAASNGEQRHPQRAFKTGQWNRPFRLADYPAVFESFADYRDTVNEDGSHLNGLNEEKSPVAVGYAKPHTPLIHWTVVVEKSRAEAYSPVATLRRILLSCAFGTAGLSLVLAFITAHRFVKPIRKLKSATQKSIEHPCYTESLNGNSSNKRSTFPVLSIANLMALWGHLWRRSSSSDCPDLSQDEQRRVFRIPAKVVEKPHLIRDELTELTRVFNEMTDELYLQYSQLDQKVAERTRELELSKKAAEAANESKTLFIANISHELKTPLNGILGMASICLEETDPAKIHESLHTIYKSGDLLLHLLTDLLNFSKNQIGQHLTLDQREFRLSDIRQQILVIFDKQVREGKIDLQVRFVGADEPKMMAAVDEVGHGLPANDVLPALGPHGSRLKDMLLWGDQHRILQILINLVSNSLKFTPPGGRVDCRIRCLGEESAVQLGSSLHRLSQPSRWSVSGQSTKESRHARSSTRPRLNKENSDNSSIGAGSTSFPENTAVMINPTDPAWRRTSATLRDRTPSPARAAKTYIYEFEVEDTGPGIAEDMHQRIFEPFVQGDLGLSRKHGGTGLGLSICQQLATLIGGSISLRSTVGVGTTFTVLLPLRYLGERPVHMARQPVTDISTRGNVEVSSSPGDLDNGVVKTGTAIERINQSPEASSSPCDIISAEPRLVGLSVPFFAAKVDPSPTPVAETPLHYVGQSAVSAGPALSLPLEPTAEGHDMETADVKVGAEASKQPADAKHHNLELPSPKQLRVLVAEDNITNIKVLSGFLAREKMVDEVVIAKNGKEAYDRVLETKKPFDLILMDIQMPLMDGLQSASLIRKAGYQTPIVALSAFSDESNVKKCFSVGMNDFLEKPLRRPRLRAMLNQFATIPEEEKTSPMLEKQVQATPNALLSAPSVCDSTSPVMTPNTVVPANCQPASAGSSAPSDVTARDSPSSLLAPSLLPPTVGENNKGTYIVSPLVKSKDMDVR